LLAPFPAPFLAPFLALFAASSGALAEPPFGPNGSGSGCQSAASIFAGKALSNAWGASMFHNMTQHPSQR
jgi:hypothetical protein